MNQTVDYKELENLYTRCMSKIIEDACQKKWNKKAFQEFVKTDRKNVHDENEKIDQTNKENKAKWKKDHPDKNESEFKPAPYITAITAKSKSFSEFDLQACNKTLLYMESVTQTILKQYQLQDQSVQINALVDKLKRLRNKLAHEEAKDTPKERQQWQDECVEHMNFILGLGFGKKQNEDGVTYRQLFWTKYCRYFEQQARCWYALSDFLDSQNYDYARFNEVCSANYILSKTEDAKFYFCTADLESTLRVLRNNLAIEGDYVAPRPTASTEAPATAPAAPVAVDDTPSAVAESPQKNHKTAYMMIGAAGALLLSGILLALVLRSALDRPSQNGDNVQNVGVTVSQSTSADAAASTTGTTTRSSTEAPTTTTTEAQSAATGSQIPAKHKQKVDRLKYADSLTLLNQTLPVVRVGGEPVPPPVAWSNIKIYSEDPSIAVGEDGMVKGVAPGTTYIIVESELGIGMAYRVIVE